MQSENRTFFLLLRRSVGDIRSLLLRNLQKNKVLKSYSKDNSKIIQQFNKAWNFLNYEIKHVLFGRNVLASLM